MCACAVLSDVCGRYGREEALGYILPFAAPMPDLPVPPSHSATSQGTAGTPGKINCIG